MSTTTDVEQIIHNASELRDALRIQLADLLSRNTALEQRLLDADSALLAHRMRLATLDGELETSRKQLAAAHVTSAISKGTEAWQLAQKSTKQLAKRIQELEQELSALQQHTQERETACEAERGQVESERNHVLAAITTLTEQLEQVEQEQRSARQELGHHLYEQAQAEIAAQEQALQQKRIDVLLAEARLAQAKQTLPATLVDFPALAQQAKQEYAQPVVKRDDATTSILRSWLRLMDELRIDGSRFHPTLNKREASLMLELSASRIEDLLTDHSHEMHARAMLERATNNVERVKTLLERYERAR